MILVILLYALFALTFSASKKALMFGSPLVLVAVRGLVSASFLLLISFWRGDSFTGTRRAIVEIMPYAALVFVSVLGANYALLQISSIEMALMYSLTPLITALFSYFLLKTKLNHLQSVGLILGFGGILLTIFMGSERAHFGGLGLPTFAECILLVAILAYSISWFFVKPLVQKHSIFYVNGLSSLLLSSVSLFLIAVFQIPIPTQCEFWQWAILQALVIGVVCYSLYMYLLNHYSANFLAFAYFTEPFFAVIYGWLLLGEVPNLNFWIATCLTTLGLFLFYRGEMTVRDGKNSQ